MAIAQGTNSKVGIAIGDPRFEEIPLVTESIAVTDTPIPNEVLIGNSGRTASDRGNRAIAGDLVTDLHYQQNALIGLAMGQESGGVYTLLNDISDELKALIDRGIDDKDLFDKGKINVMTIAGAVGAPVTATFNCVFTSFAKDSSTEVETSTLPPRVIFSDLTFMVSKKGQEPKEVPVSSIELVLTNNLQVDGYASKVGNDPREILTPIRNGRRDVTFKFVVPRVDEGNAGMLEILTAKQNGDLLEAQATFSNGSDNEFNIKLPNLQITSGGEPLIAGPTVLTAEFACNAFRDPESGKQEFEISIKSVASSETVTSTEAVTSTKTVTSKKKKSKKKG